MLGRTANDLYWMARYMERAENLARILDVGYRLLLLPHEQSSEIWRSALRSAGCEQSYTDKYSDFETDRVEDFLLFDPDNPSSVYSCIARARESARIQRTAITRDMWECLNGAWIEYCADHTSLRNKNERPILIDWIKGRSALFRGALMNTILRNDSFNFCEIGTFLERADNTARILDVKYFILLPQNQLVGGGIDNVQWQTILRSVSAHQSYSWVYRDRFNPWNIAHFLILNNQMPRSLRSCYDGVSGALKGLNDYYGYQCDCYPMVEKIRSQLVDGDMNEIFQSGLHEFLTDFIANNNEIGAKISEIYHFNE